MRWLGATGEVKLTPKWGQVPASWVYGVRVPAYDTLRIEIAIGGASVAKGGVVGEVADVRHCQDDLIALREQLGRPDLKVFVIQKSHLPEELRGQHLGTRMYDLFIREAAKRGFAVAPNHCWHGGPGSGMTSADALRVWASMRKRFMTVGELVWGGS